jgi:hypothetical protein
VVEDEITAVSKSLLRLEDEGVLVIGGLHQGPEPGQALPLVPVK